MNVLSRITALLPACLRCALAFQAFIFALSAVAAVAAMARHASHPNGAMFASIGIFLLLATGLLVLSTRIRNDWRFAILLTLGALAVRVLLLASAGDTQQVGDSQLFSNSLRTMIANGLGDDAIRQMFQRDYDTHVWLTRAFPFFLPLARAFPADFVTIAQFTNLIASALTNLLAFWLYRRWLAPRAARFAFVLLSLIPLHTWQSLEFTHQFQGALFVACACVALVRILDAAAQSRFAWGAGVALAVSLVLLRAQGGMDLFLLLATGFAGVVLFAFRGASPTFRRLAPVLLVALGVLYFPTARWMSQSTARFADVNQNSHPYSFLARGWNLPTWGEFYGPYEMVDRVTPLPQKRDTMLGLVVSQMTYEPAKTLIALPWVKLAKFHLVGFASNAEQQLAASEHTTLTSLSRGTRLIFAPLFLVLAALGCWRWRELAANRPEAWVVILLPLLFAAVYLVFGETSPRYSFHTNFSLALLAGVGLDGLLARKFRPDFRTNALPTLATAAAFTALLGLLALALPPLFRKTASHLFLADMRTAKTAAYSVGPTIFEQTVQINSTNPAAIAVAEIEILRPSAHNAISFVLRPSRTTYLGRSSASGSFTVSINEQIVAQIDARYIRSDRFLTIPLDGSRDTRLSLKLTQSYYSPRRNGLPLDADAFHWGYLRTF